MIVGTPQRHPEDWTAGTVRYSGVLRHVTPNAQVAQILRDGLAGPVHLSSDDDIDTVAWYHVLGNEPDGVTTLRIDVSGMSLHWPGYDGAHHYATPESIPVERIIVERVRDWPEVRAYLLTMYGREKPTATWLARHV